MPRLVTLLTDFGTRDSYVAEVKASILTIAADVMCVDIAHDVTPGDVAEAQYLLERSWHRFPPGSVHLVVVDPGVGTGRRALAATALGHGFVAPDNGLLTGVLDDAEVVSLVVPAGAAPTFHGRDVFGPAAARLAAGTPLASLGTPVPNALRRRRPEPARRENDLVGEVIYVDRFGNLVTNLTVNPATPGRIRVRGIDVGVLRHTFGDVAHGQVVAYVGSGGTVEVAVRNGSARDWLKAGVGAEVVYRGS